MSVVAAGFFDGVHIGHRAILKGADVALTFKNHPLSVLDYRREPSLIMSYSAKKSAIVSCGIKRVISLEFTKELSELPAEQFLRYFDGFSKIRCGNDWRFGKGAQGDAEFLRRHGFDVEVVPCVELDGERVSSSRIRAAISNGDIALVNRLLGHRWVVEGEVVRGKGLGSKIGFPTVNVIVDAKTQPMKAGVYEVAVGGCKAVANWGHAPTMGDDAWKNKVLELHFETLPDDFAAGGRCNVEIIDFIRPERKFESIDELKNAIARDCDKVFAPCASGGQVGLRL